MSVLDQLEPKSVFTFFEDLCAIPHGSRNTKQISDYLVSFAEERKLEHYQDNLNNVIIIKEASKGYEDAPAVIIQGHIDMVCEKAPGCTKNMDTEGLDLEIEGDTILARGTTLGGDDGIAIAMGLALIDADNLSHPRIELLCTVDEEVGMEGAFGVDLSPLKGRIMINIDSEDEGIFTVGCAGGCTADCTLSITREAYNGKKFRISIEGLRGGHSGEEIDKFRANADILMARLLYALGEKTDYRLVSVNGGLKGNAIPTASAAEIVCEDSSAVSAVYEEMEAVFQKEYSSSDTGINLSVVESDADSFLPMDKESTKKVSAFLLSAPNGIQEMSADIPGLIETSLNLGILVSDKDTVSALFCIRSSVDTRRSMICSKLEALTSAFSGSCVVSGKYPGWKYKPDSSLRSLMVDVFKEQYGHEPVVKAIHAGLECGLFMDRLPDLDCISIGPDITDIHTFKERLHIASTQRTWALVVETLKRIK